MQALSPLQVPGLYKKEAGGISQLFASEALFLESKALTTPNPKHPYTKNSLSFETSVKLHPYRPTHMTL